MVARAEHNVVFMQTRLLTTTIPLPTTALNNAQAGCWETGCTAKTVQDEIENWWTLLLTAHRSVSSPCFAMAPKSITKMITGLQLSIMRRHMVDWSASGSWLRLAATSTADPPRVLLSSRQLGTARERYVKTIGIRVFRCLRQLLTLLPVI
jgi:hypothetical protein